MFWRLKKKRKTTRETLKDSLNSLILRVDLMRVSEDLVSAKNYTKSIPNKKEMLSPNIVVEKEKARQSSINKTSPVFDHLV